MESLYIIYYVVGSLNPYILFVACYSGFKKLEMKEVLCDWRIDYCCMLGMSCNLYRPNALHIFKLSPFRKVLKELHQMGFSLKNVFTL